MKGKVEGKFAIVTGGAMGMGRGVAEKLLEYGATVSIIDYSDQLDDTLKELQANGAKVQGFHCDVRDKEKLTEIYDGIAEQYGRIDILVNVAGVSKTMPYFTDEGCEEERDFCMGVNVYGLWNSCRAAIPYMMKQKYGKIVNFASVTGPIVVDPGMIAYATSKGAAMAFTKALASEMAGQNITVNAILPGLIDTPMCRAAVADAPDPQAVLDAMAQGIPMKRLGTPAEAGELAAFLASDESSYITGQGIILDGGNSVPETHDTGWTPDAI